MPENINPVSCGQKSIKIESNRSNRMFCLISRYLSDFSRSAFYPLIVETVHAPSNSQIINKISQTEHAPSLQAKLYVMSCGQKSIKIESNRSNRTFCQICCYLSDFSRSDFLISFGASAPLSNRSTQPPINCRNVARRVSTHQIEYHAIKKEVLPPP